MAERPDRRRPPVLDPLDGPQVAALLGLEPLPGEGGLWAQSWLDPDSSAIYFLMQPGDFSAMHRLTSVELWHHYAGAPVAMLLLGPAGTVERPVLGIDLPAGERPMQPVPAGVWMGARTTGDWSLVGTTMAPPYDPDGFELGTGETLAARYPSAAADIAELTRSEPPS